MYSLIELGALIIIGLNAVICKQKITRNCGLSVLYLGILLTKYEHVLLQVNKAHHLVLHQTLCTMRRGYVVLAL